MEEISSIDGCDVPLSMYRLHRRLRAAENPAPVRVALPTGWPDGRADDLAHLCGLRLDHGGATVLASPFVTAPSTLAAGLDIVIVGVNPSPRSAEMMVPFGRNGNRCWPSLAAAGLALVDRAPEDLLVRGKVGMTDLTKIVTRRADEVSADELRRGIARLERVLGWLVPRAVVVLGVTAWRTATGDRGVVLGRQPNDFAGSALWVLPNPSGLNAHTSVDDMTQRWRAVIDEFDGHAGTLDREVQGAQHGYSQQAGRDRR